MSPEQSTRPQQEPSDFQPTRARELLHGETMEANTPGWQVVRPSQGRENKQISQQRMSQQQPNPDPVNAQATPCLTSLVIGTQQGPWAGIPSLSPHPSGVTQSLSVAVRP